MSNRDEQFAGFAKALLQRIDEAIGKEADRAERGEATQTQQEFANMLGVIIAHAAYDLSLHVLDHIEDGGMFAGLHERPLEDVPDMLELPEEKSE